MQRYRLCWRGVLPPEQVRFEYAADRCFQPQAGEVGAIARVCEQRRRLGQRVTNSPLYQVLEWGEDPAGLHLRLGRTCYEDYLGLSLLEPARAPWVLAVAAATEIEGRLVLEKRSRQVAQGLGLVHVKPSGHVHPPQSAWQALLAESWEELALQPEEIVEAHCLGLVQSLTANCYCLTYALRTRLSWAEWTSRVPEDAWEAEELSGLAIDIRSLDEWLERPAELSTGPGQAAVRLYREWRYPRV